MAEQNFEIQRPDIKNYNLDDGKINFLKNINEQKQKEGGILLFAFSFSLIVTTVLVVCLSIYSPESIEQEGGLFRFFLIGWWTMFCGVFAIWLIPLVRYILVPFLIVYKVIYKEINMFLNYPMKKRQLAKIYEIHYNKYLSDLSTYNRKIEEIRRNKEVELKRQAEIEKEKIRHEKLIERNYWFSMSGYTFEKEIEILYRKAGYQVNRTKYSGDGGIDLIMYNRNNDKIIVQCKNHKNPVGPSIVRELYGVMIAEDASKAILICSGGFTEGVFAFARNKNLELLDLDKIIELNKLYQ